MWTLDLARTYRPTHTRGHLRLLDEGRRERYACAVLELPWLDNARNVSCIPEGSYNTRHYTRPSGKGEALLVEGVQGRGTILFHTGNETEDTRGCLLPGTWQGDGIVNSRVALDALLSMLPRGERHRLVVRAAGLEPDALTPLLVALAAGTAFYFFRRRP